MEHGKVIWITGLSGAGKSTLAEGLSAELKILGEQVIILDGDELRTILSELSEKTKEPDRYARTTRIELAMCYSKLCKTLAHQGFTVVISTISMFTEIYSWNEENLPNYFLVYLDVPLDVRETRDPKGIYKGFRDGKIRNFVGLDQSFDEPIASDWRPVFDSDTTNDLMVKNLIAVLTERGYL